MMKNTSKNVHTRTDIDTKKYENGKKYRKRLLLKEKKCWKIQKKTTNYEKEEDKKYFTEKWTKRKKKKITKKLYN